MESFTHRAENQMLPGDALQQFIENIGDRAEGEFWLKLFRAEAKERFAVLVAEVPVLDHAFDVVVVQLRFLAAVGLTPVVALGIYDPSDTVSYAHSLREGLSRAGVPCRLVSFAGAGESVEDVVAATGDHTIPIVPFGIPGGAQAAQRFEALGRLVTAVRARKLIFLSRRGALAQGAEKLSIVNLTTDYDELAASPELTGKQRMLLEQARRLVLVQVPHKLHVAVTSPLDLLRELFTVKGAGTLFRRGAVIELRQSFDHVEVPRLKALLEDSFGRTPRPEFFDSSPSHIYLEEAYRGAALVQARSDGSYLSKFAVSREAQGEGLGRDLWARLTADHPLVWWRSRHDNPIAAWYVKEADGFVRTPAWLVFWRGAAVERIPHIVEHTLSVPDDMSPGPFSL
jgi:hypothetical protein